MPNRRWQVFGLLCLEGESTVVVLGRLGQRQRASETYPGDEESGAKGKEPGPREAGGHCRLERLS